MKEAPNLFRAISSMVAAALFGLIVGFPAWAEDGLFNSYRVDNDNSTQNNHDKAVYIVFSTPNSPTMAGLLFMERNGPYKDQLFICDDAVWLEDGDSYSCERFVPRGNSFIKEVVTVGTIDGTFCQTLRGTQGTGRRILSSDDCKKLGVKCSCYEVQHLCKNRDEYAPCQNNLAPSSGAGTGKEN